MATKICLVCKKEFYRYRNALKYCSRKCFSSTRVFKENKEYIKKIKNILLNNIEIDKKTNCWNYLKNNDEWGRGRIWFRNTTVISSRVSYIIFKNEIPKGIFVCHTCDNYKCVNPDHLFLGTCQDNINDRQYKKRGASGEKIGISKLKENDILEIRKLSMNKITQAEIAKLYNVSQVCIGRVLNKKTWQHI